VTWVDEQLQLHCTVLYVAIRVWFFTLF